MPVGHAVEGVHWCQQLDANSGKVRFNCLGTDCKSPMVGYTRLHALNVHMMPRHNVRASILVGHGHRACSMAGRAMRDPPQRTRIASRNPGGRLKGKRVQARHGQQRMPNVAPSKSCNHQKTSSFVADENKLHAFVQLKHSLEISLKAISQIIGKPEGPNKKKRAPVGRGTSLPKRAGVPSFKPPIGSSNGKRKAPAPKRSHVPNHVAILVNPTPCPPEDIVVGSLEMRRQVNQIQLANYGGPGKNGREASQALVLEAGVVLQETPPSLGGISEDFPSPPSTVLYKSPAKYSRVDPNSILIDAWRSVREVIHIDNGSPVAMYDVDQDSPTCPPRGSSTLYPIRIFDSLEVDSKSITVDRSGAHTKGALNLKWDGIGKVTFLLPKLGKINLGKTQTQDGHIMGLESPSPPSVSVLLKETGESSNTISELLAKIDNLPILPSCPSPAHLANKVMGTMGVTTVGLPVPIDSLSQLDGLSNQSNQWALDDFEGGHSHLKKEGLVDYVSDSGSA